MINSLSKLCSDILKYDKNKLIAVSKNLDAYYNSFIKKQLKPNGVIKERKIDEAVGELKIIHKKILKHIFHEFEFPSPPFIGGLKGKDNILNAHFHKGNTYKFCTDLKDFYPHINHNMVYKSFIKIGYSPDVASILTKLLTYRGAVTQGGANSTHLAYLTFLETAEKLSKICDANQITFTIYVDDITFSSQTDFKELSIELRDIIIAGGYKINHNKTFYTRGKANMTGVTVGQNTLNVLQSFRDKLSETNHSHAKKEGLFRYFERVVTYYKVSQTNKFSQ